MLGHNHPVNNEYWNGYVKDQNYLYMEDINDTLAPNVAVRIYFDGELVEEFIITEDGNVTFIQ
jgi:hypothetical protein